MRKFTLFLAFLLIFLSTQSQAQDSNPDMHIPFSLGLYGGFNLNMHNPNLPDSIPLFDVPTNSLTGHVGAIALFPINNTFVISTRFGYNPVSAMLEKEVSGTQYQLEAKLSYFELSPILQFHNLLPMKPLYFLAGLEFGIPLQKSFVRNDIIATGVPETNVRMAVALGAGYMIQLSPKIYLSPEVSFRFPFNQVSPDADYSKWSIPQLRLGVNLTFSLESDEETPTKPKTYGLDVGIKEVRSYNNDGTTTPVKSVKVEDVQYSELYPFIPYVFLDEKTVEPQNENQVLRGKSQSGEFTIQKLEPDAVKINKSTLDIIGTRMQENPSSELTITGTNDGSKEKDSKDLALQRAIYAKDYLVENYSINPELINVRGSGLPAKPSSMNVEDGIAENRRVEFQSSNPELFKPILIEGENQRLAEPELLEFIPKIVTEDSITSWSLEISQADNMLRRNSGIGMPPPMQWAIRPNELTNKQIPIDYKLTVRTASGLEKTSTGSIPTEYLSTNRKHTEELPDRTISKYSLILFDFDKADVNPGDRDIIEKYILPSVKFNSTIKIYGYTDRIGEEKYNQELALKRATTVKEIIQSKMKDVKIDVFGVGESVPVYNNDSPVGRQLSRTVQVHVITPK